MRKNRYVTWIAMAMWLLAAPATGGVPGCNVDSESTFRDWQQWTKLTSSPVRSRGHSSNWVDIYTDEIATDTYRSATAPYEECAKTIKPEYTDSSAEVIRKLTIMVKMPAGYDPDHAN